MSTVGAGGGAGSSPAVTGRPWAERALRRRLPMGRLAVLEANGRSHIVGLADVSVTGAYLLTRLHLSVDEVHVLSLVLGAGTELSVRARIVRLAQAASGSSQPGGVAVQFLEMSSNVRRQLEAFVGWRAKPAS